jgi:hypothetical protein
VTGGKAAFCVVVLAGALASPAFAERIPLGVATAQTTANKVDCTSSPCTQAQSSSPQGSFTAPADGHIVSWWAAHAGGFGASAELRVLRRVIPLTQVRYQAVGTSSSAGVDPHATRHDTDLPVRANDLIGVTVRGYLFYDADTGATDGFSGAFPDGTAELSDSQGKGTLEYGAEFVFRPVVTGLDTTSAPTAGGGTLTLAGSHLTDSTAVLFGATPATGMTVVSNAGITVQIPPGSGTVDVTVVGPGGTSLTTAADRFTYLARSATVNPSVLDFGHALVGSSSGVRSVTLTNNGKVTVSVGTDTLGGPDAGEFATLSDGCAGHDIVAGSSCSVKLAFTPGASGGRNATLGLGDNSTDGPHTVVLTGTGDNPAPTATTTTAVTTTTTVTTVTTPAATAPRAPSRAFTVGRLNGTRLRVTLGSRGTVRVAGRLLRPSSAAGGPGAVVVELRLTAPARASLGRRHRLALRVRITFTPRGGRPATKVRSLLVRSARA